MKTAMMIELFVLLIIGLGSIVGGVRLIGLDSVQFDRLGPHGYNIGMGAILIILGIAYFLSITKREVKAEREAKGKIDGDRASAGNQQRSDTIMMLSIIAIMTVYALLINRIGYLLSSAVFFVLINKVVGFRSWLSILAASAVMTGCYYVVFVKWLGMVLPRGLWVQF